MVLEDIFLKLIEIYWNTSNGVQRKSRSDGNPFVGLQC